jgi:lysine 2,3-aminomutase
MLIEPRRLRVASRKARARPADWRWQVRNAVTSVAELAARLRLSEAERAGAERAERAGLPIGITPYYLSLCDPNEPSCPIRLQCVPRAEEGDVAAGDLVDPLGEVAHEVAPNLICRYPDRALLLVTDRCAVYCRFCTRSRVVGSGHGAAGIEAIGPALAWLRAHPEVRDVIVSGGDPLAMSTERIVRVLRALREIDHIETIRIGTRIPVTLPMRVTRELVHALRPFHPIWVMTHFNHPRELTPASRRALARLVDAGFPVMNQTVLLAGINDDPHVLEELLRGLVRERVRPYYLLQMDPVVGTSHLRTPLERGVEIMAALQGRLTGIALPKLVCDTPGGKGKVPLAPEVVIARAPGRTTLRTFRGELVDYIDPPRRRPGAL